LPRIGQQCGGIRCGKIPSFAAPNTTTLLTNTRQCTELPSVFMDQLGRLSSSSHIFSFCTGGVRCERATRFLDQLLKENCESQPTETTKKKPQVYQLRGGIQRYLEYAVTDVNLFRGKNFVFDPRRTDPVHGDDVTGQCMLCQKPHDDYDNGHAPADRKEARCIECRILLLVCNDCRPTVKCWGDDKKKKNKDDDDRSSDRLLFCGGVDAICLKTVPVEEIRKTSSLKCLSRSKCDDVSGWTTQV